VQGTKWAGFDGDVDVTGTPFRLECKYAVDLRSLKTKQYHDQILEYEKRNPEKVFGLVYTGGRSYQNARIWVTVPIETFLATIRSTRRETLLLRLLEQPQFTERADSAVALIADIAQYWAEDIAREKFYGNEIEVYTPEID
jgi:hypothetical protein